MLWLRGVRVGNRLKKRAKNVWRAMKQAIAVSVLRGLKAIDGKGSRVSVEADCGGNKTIVVFKEIMRARQTWR